MELYDYQQRLVDSARKSYLDGFKAPCIVSPCGSGKSIMIAEIVKLSTENRKKVLFLVHRQELLSQIENTLKNHGVDMRYVELGMVMTVVRRLNKMDKPDLIIVDENHHVLAKSYIKILEHFDTKVLGFTATPVRLNGDGLGDVNDILIEGPTVKWLIENKRLANYSYYSLPVVKYEKLKKNSTGEFTTDSITSSFDKTIFGDVVKHYQKLADGQKTIIYAHSIDFSKMWVELFNQQGITAEHVDGTTPKSERNRIMEDFRTGKITVLSNVDLIGEGFDVPDCSCVILLRPTQSLSLHIQQAMRSMRYKPDKHATIIDHVGNVYRHGLPDMDRTWNLDKKKRKNKNDVEPYPTWECPECLSINHKLKGMNTCRSCGFEEEFVQEETAKTIDVKTQLEKIENFNFYAHRNPNLAKSYRELVQIAKAKGYKPSWAGFKAHQLNLKDTPEWVKKFKQKQKKESYSVSIGGF